MRKIAVLDKNTIDKIAAGEVVERPSSVVKELTENAIDAGATAVTVEIKDGGKSLIRITDNGSGIDQEQVPLAFVRHATSKIEKVEDLEHIVSLGFRGEALSSIAAVSQVELITKTPSSITGVRYVIEGGEEKSLEEVGAPEGTTFLVHNLFYNVPARSKFLKTAVTEGNYVSSLMEQMALSHPEISFKYIVNGQVKLHTSGNYNRKDVIYQIYGRDITKELLEVHEENEYLKITGYIGKPSVNRGNRNFENYYINGRFVKNKIVSKAIEDAYKGYMMQHSFPFTSLEIEMSGNELDVNVHPAKMEVRFSDGQQVYDMIYQAVSQTLKGKEMIPEVQAGQEKKEAQTRPKIKPGQIPEPFEVRQLQKIREEEPPKNRWERLDERMRRNSPVLKPQEEILFKQKEENKEKEEALSLDDVKENLREEHREEQEILETAVKSQSRQMDLFETRMLSEKARSQHRLIGQLFDTYWLVQYEDKFYIIDQHAAHEKVLYEKIVHEYQNKEILSQYLSPPILVSLTMQEQTLLEDHMDLFKKFGFEIEPFGGKEYSIHGVPMDLYGYTEGQLFVEMLDELEQDGKISAEIFAGRMATMACKAAVKGNNRLSLAEANQLIDQLLTLDNPYHCPHGRPTIIAMTKTELEKKFKRIV